MPRAITAFVFTAVLSLITTIVSFAQQPPGLPRFATYATGIGPVESINLGDLNVHVMIPFRDKKGRGLDYHSEWHHDNTIWEWNGTKWTITNTPYQGRFTGMVGDWTTVQPPVIEYASNTYTCPAGGQLSTTSNNFSYVDTNDTTHYFPNVAVNNLGCTYPTTASGYDEQGDLLQVTVNSSDSFTVEKVTTRSGVTYDQLAGKIIDSNGNEITSPPGYNPKVYTDTLDTTVLTTQLNGSMPSSATYTGENGANETITVNHTLYYLKSNFSDCSGTAGQYSSGQWSFPTSVVLPDNSQYTISYQSAGSGAVTGLIGSIGLPTGGTINYSYTGGHGGLNCDGSVNTLTRTTPDGTWTYVHTPANSSGVTTTTVTDPLLNVSVYSFYQPSASSVPLEIERQVYTGNKAQLLETVITCYNGQSESSCTTTPNSITSISRITRYTQLPNGVQAETDEYYNSNQFLTERDEYDFGATSPTRKHFIAYGSYAGGNCSNSETTALTNSNILGAICEDVTTSGSGSLGQTSTWQAATLYSYDQTGVSSTGATQHTSPPGSARGNPTTLSLMSQAGGAAYLNKSISYYDTGLPQTVTDVNGGQYTYTYTSGACDYAFPTQISEPMSLSRSMTWDSTCEGGVMTSVTDENGKTINIGYSGDPFWRPTSETDQEGNITNFSYNPGNFESTLNFNSGASTVDVYHTFDPLGRPQLDQQHQSPSSPNWDTVWHGYDADGRPDKTSIPYVCSKGGSCTGTPTVNASYDGMGRITQTVAADGQGTISYTYTQNDVLYALGPAPTGENTKRKQMEYDGLGRLTSVCELTTANGSGSCSQTSAQTGYWTKYTYDVLDDLTGVTQDAQSSSTQGRSYTYDALGRLTLEANPETGGTATPTKYTYDTDATCGTSNGDLVKRVDAVGNVTCYAYDKLHRVTSISYPSGSYASATPTKTFIYDSATVNGVVMANTGGRLAEAYTGSKATDTGFVYSVRGELTEIWEKTPNSGGYYHPTAAFWANGALSNLWISKLPSISYGADGEGRISTVSDSSGNHPVSSASYNVASQLTGATLGSSDTISFTYDSNTGRMTQYNLAINGSSIYGSLTWNPNGTLQKLAITDPFNSADSQTCSYLYDDLGRIGLPPGSTGKSVDCGASTWQQDFSYDAFGNITKTVPSGGTGISWQPTYSTSTNQYTAIPGATPKYDADGNLTYDSFHNYTWDAEGHPVTIDGLGLTYDALGRMVELKNGTSYTQYVWWPSSQKFAIMSGQSLDVAMVPLPGGAEVKYTSSGLSAYRMADWLGSLRAASNPNRTYNGSLAFAPFGERYAVSGTPAYAFTGQRADVVTDEYDFVFRKYHSTQGRWVSPDPAGLAAAHPMNPQTWNRYAYVAGNPLIGVDLLGLCAGGGTSDFAPPSSDQGTISVTTYAPCPPGITLPTSSWVDLAWEGLPLSVASNFDVVCGMLGWCDLSSQQQQPGGGGTQSTTGKKGYCANQGTAPSPSEFAAKGKAFIDEINFLRTHAPDPDAVFFYGLGELHGAFGKGGPLDAQTGASGTLLERASYGNYAYGAFFAGAGIPLPDALSAANAYGYKQQLFGGAYGGRTMDTVYTHLPLVNVQDITNGYNDEVSGTLCDQ